MKTPLMILSLFIIWLLLQQEISFASVLLAAVLAFTIPWLTHKLSPFSTRVKHPVLIIKLIYAVLMDILRSAISVALLILFPSKKGMNSQFIYIPLDLKNPSGLAVLAGIVNSTPGTVWVDITPHCHQLLLHVFDLKDEAWWVNHIKNNYETPLIAIFES